MTDKKEDKKPDQEEKSAAPDAAKNTENNSQPGPIPYDRFKQVNEQRKALEERLSALEDEENKRKEQAKKAEEKRLEEQEKYQELATQYKADLESAQSAESDLQSVVDRQTEVLQALYDVRKRAVPEMFQPVLDKLDLVERIQWLAENEDKLKPETTNGIPHTPAPKGKGEPSPEERRRRTARVW